MRKVPAHVPGAAAENARREQAREGTARQWLDRRRTPWLAHRDYYGNARSVIGHSLATSYGSNWMIMLSGFVEPVLYLLSMGIGVGALVGSMTYHGQHLPYGAYIAPALLATSAMNGAVYDSTWNVFFKLRFSKVYESMLATPLGPLDVALGEIGNALVRGVLYSSAFMLLMQVLGYNLAWTALLAVPACVLVAFGFAALGMSVTSYCRTFVHMDWIMVVLLPMFLLSATFFPITVYPPVFQGIVMAFPLWHAVELVRMLTTGTFDAGIWWHLGYFAAMSVLGVVVVTRRLRSMFLA